MRARDKVRCFRGLVEGRDHVGTIERWYAGKPIVGRRLLGSKAARAVNCRFHKPTPPAATSPLRFWPPTTRLQVGEATLLRPRR
jgi:hypothetical protein